MCLFWLACGALNSFASLSLRQDGLLPPRKTGLATFTDKQASSARSQEAVEDLRTRAKGEIVHLTLRLSREQWERVHQLGLSKSMSLNRLAIHALSKLFQEKGLPGL